jgi:hypothetical protein
VSFRSEYCPSRRGQHLPNIVHSEAILLLHRKLQTGCVMLSAPNDPVTALCPLEAVMHLSNCRLTLPTYSSALRAIGSSWIKEVSRRSSWISCELEDDHNCDTQLVVKLGKYRQHVYRQPQDQTNCVCIKNPLCLSDILVHELMSKEVDT